MPQKGFVLSIVSLRRKYGVSLFDIARAGKVVAGVEGMDRSEAAGMIALKLLEQQSDLKQRVEGISGADWEQFFQGLIELIEVLLPLIVQIIMLFL